VHISSTTANLNIGLFYYVRRHDVNILNLQPYAFFLLTFANNIVSYNPQPLCKLFLLRYIIYFNYTQTLMY